MPKRISFLFVAALLIFPSLVFAQDLEEGCDCWQTEPGTQVALPYLPEGFFGTKNGTPSDAIPPQVIQVRGEPLPDSVILAHCPDAIILRTVWLDRHGNPVSPDDIHRVTRQTEPVGVEPIDTIVCRNTDITFSGVGVPEPVPIELVELSLYSIDPITVTFGVEPPSLYDVTITEDGDQYVGQMTLTPIQIDPTIGDTMLDSLPVGYVITFIDVGEIRPPVSLPHADLDFVDTRGVFGVGVDPPTTGVNESDSFEDAIVFTAEPNPFTRATLLRYRLNQPGELEIDIYDATGRLVRHLVDTTAEAGSNAVEWDGRNDAGARVGPGLYFARLRAGGEVRLQRMLTLE